MWSSREVLLEKLCDPSTRGHTGSRCAQPRDVLFAHALALGLVRDTHFCNHDGNRGQKW